MSQYDMRDITNLIRFNLFLVAVELKSISKKKVVKVTRKVKTVNRKICIIIPTRAPKLLQIPFWNKKSKRNPKNHNGQKKIHLVTDITKIYESAAGLEFEQSPKSLNH